MDVNVILSFDAENWIHLRHWSLILIVNLKLYLQFTLFFCDALYVRVCTCGIGGDRANVELMEAAEDHFWSSINSSIKNKMDQLFVRFKPSSGLLITRCANFAKEEICYV